MYIRGVIARDITDGYSLLPYGSLCDRRRMRRQNYFFITDFTAHFVEVPIVYQHDGIVGIEDVVFFCFVFYHRAARPYVGCKVIFRKTFDPVADNVMGIENSPYIPGKVVEQKRKVEIFYNANIDIL